MLRRPVNLCGVLFCLLICSQLARAQCKQPRGEDGPHGGKGSVLVGEGTVGGIYGKVLRKDEKADDWVPVGDVVVELYVYGGRANREDVSKAVREQKRVAACLTGGDGKYSFTGLEPGRYLLRAGTRAPDKYDVIYAILVIDPRRRDSGQIILLPSSP
jgi:hypothetical protein